MKREDKSTREIVVELTKETGILPCIKLKEKMDYLAFAKAMYDGGARVIEVTMTTPKALEAIEAISSEFEGKLHVGAGTVLDPSTAREVILHGGKLIVSPTVNREVIKMANRYCIPCYSGAFTPTECQEAMAAGAAMIKIFPAQLGGPKYMTHLKMVFPDVNLIPSGGINLNNAAEYIRCGACAVSGARTFMDFEMINQHGMSWLSQHINDFIKLINETKKNLPLLP